MCRTGLSFGLTRGGMTVNPGLSPHGSTKWVEWAGISARTMSRRFVTELGLTFARWRQQARLLRALERIADGTPVTTIALDLGYDNVSAFIDMFRRALGTTPGRYMALTRRDTRNGYANRSTNFGR